MPLTSLEGPMQCRSARLFPLLGLVLAGACSADRTLAPSGDLSLAAGPGNPGNLTSTAVSPSQINLAWADLSSNENGFELQWSTAGPNGTFVPLTTTAANTSFYSNVSLASATEYCYRVRAFRITGRKTNYSAFSNTACATTEETPPPPPPPPGPTAPSGTNARPASSLVHTAQITWTDNSSDENGFRVERAPSADGPWALATTASANNTSHIDYGQPMEQQLCYRVVAFYTAGGESPSNVDCTYLPATPSGLTVTAASGAAVELSWTDNSAHEDSYDIERSETGGWPFTNVGSVGSDVTTFRDATVSANRTYTYRVWVSREGARAGASNQVTAITATDVPPAPSSVDVYPSGSTGIGVNWSDAAANETGFRIERSENGGAAWSPAGSVVANSSGFSDGGRTPERQVCYRVFAFNAVGDSPPSPMDCTVPPAAPTNLIATTAPGLAIDLTWTDNSSVEDGYTVLRWFDDCGGYYYYYCNRYYAPIADLAPNVTSYRDEGLGRAVAHSYVVVARKDGGTSDQSNEANAWSNLPSAAPSNVTATAVSRTQIDVAWSDNSTEEDSFVIARCTGTPAACEGVSFTSSFWVGANITSFSDTTAQPNTTYTYQVFAYNGHWTASTNRASATTPP